MEAGKEKHTPSAVKTRRHWVAFKQMLALFGLGLRLCGLYERGLRNARRIELKRMELAFANLPAEFDGFRILQLSDLHVDFLPEPLETALDLVSGEEVDLCVLTGDYRKRVSGPFAQILPAFENLLARLRS
jgi:predicted MPP superfamily phosphohydrolase